MPFNERKLLFFILICVLSFPALAVDVQISQLIDTPDPAIRNGDITYSIAVLNGAADTASSVVVTMPLPATTSFVSVNNGACSHAGSPGTVTCNLGDITGDGFGNPVTNIDVVISTSAATGTGVNVTATAATASVDSNGANDSLNQNTTIDDGADLVTTITDSPDPVVAGANVGYTLAVSNNGPDDAATTTVVNTLPADITYVSASGSGWSCSNVGQDVTCTRSSISNASSAPDITIIGQVTGAVTGTITNTSTVSSTTGDPDTNNNTTTEDTTVNSGTDLAITKLVSSPVIANQPATFTLRPRNNGPFTANTVSVTDTLPAGWVLLSATGTGWSCSNVGQDVTCTRASYAVGATDNITITATAPATGTFSNTGSISSATNEADNSNNSDTVNTITIVPDGADLSMTKNKSPDPVAQGSNATSTLQVTNNGPQATSGILTVTDNLSAGETFVGFSGTNWSCSHNGVNPGGVVTCTYSATPLVAGANTSNLIITTTATNAGVLTNNASATDVGGTADAVPGNDTPSASVTSTASIADLQMVKTADDPLLDDTENTITYTLTATNNGPATVSGVVVTDTIPGFVSGSTTVLVNETSGSEFTCTAGSTVTCTMNGGQTMTNGEMAVFTVTVTRPLFDGVLNNTATVTSTDLGDNDLNNNSDTTTVTVEPIADMEMVSKTVTPGSTNAGTNATYVLTLRNNGPSSADAVTVADVFTPPSICGGGAAACTYTLISATPSQGSCSPLAGNTLNCSIGTVARNQTETITIIVRPDWDTGNTAWDLPNTATVSTTTKDSDGANDSDSATLMVTQAQLDLLVNKTDQVDPIGFDPAAGPSDNIIVYRVNMTNRGPSLATGVTLTDVMTPKTGKQLTFMCDDAGSASCTVGFSLCNNTGTSATGPASLTMTCNLPDLTSNSSTTRYLFFKVDSAPDGSGDTHNNTATISSNENDTVSANDSESETTSVRVKVDLGVSKTSASPVSLREPFDWTIVVANSGPGDSDVSDLTDTLPTGMELTATPTPDQGSCTGVAGDTSFSCSLGTINNGANVTVTVPVRVTIFPAGGTLTNTACATSFGVDSNTANDCDSTAVTVQKSSLAGTVFIDPNDNGNQDGGDTGINNVSIQLTGTDAYGNAVNTTLTTNASGDYLFDDLSPSDGAGYTVTETAQPAGFVDGLENAGDPGGTNIIGGSRATDLIPAINLLANTPLTGYDFAEVAVASVAGVVWHDESKDGIRDAGETIRIPNVTITLTGTDDLGNTVNQVTTTAADGSYLFTDLRAGTYILTETHPPAWADGGESVGSAGGTVGNDVISNIVLGSTVNATDYDFGEQGSSLAGKVYRDLDNDGVIDALEPGIPGVTITVTGTDATGAAVNRVTTTGVDGSYRIGGLAQPDGAGYTITETQPGGVGDGIDTVGDLGGTVANDVFSAIMFPAPGADGINYNFGEGGLAVPASLSGKVWFDLNHDRVDNDSNGQPTWTVELIANRADPADNTNITLIATAVTDSSGNYSFTGLSPGNYEVRFRHPQGGYIYGTPVSGGSAGLTDFSTIRNLTLIAGDNITNQDLPIDPQGVVYDALTRNPVPGAVVTIGGPAGFNPAADLVGGVGNVSQTTGANGLYQFLLFNTAPAGDYTLTVTSPPAYLPGVAASIPACTNSPVIPAAPNPALVQTSATAPVLAAPIHDPATCPVSSAGFAGSANSTQYYLSFNIDPTLPSGNIINNHIPLDPITSGAITISKAASLVNVSRGGLVPYTLRASNNLTSALTNINITDQMPPGFKYRSGSATVDGVALEPTLSGRTLIWSGLTFAVGQERVITLMLVVGSGVGDGEYINQAWAINSLAGATISNIASASVRVVPDPVFDCSDLIGKVFDDRNANGYQDEGEPGLPNVRVTSIRGLLTTTDDKGRFHVACADVPDQDRGSNFIMKLDERTLPSGYRVTTENPRVVRLTRGKLNKLNFGAAIHRVIRVEMESRVFNADNNDLNTSGEQKLTELLNLLDQGTATLRLVYRQGDDEIDKQAKQRLKQLVKRIKHDWVERQEADKEKCCRDLIIEAELIKRPMAHAPLGAAPASCPTGPSMDYLNDSLDEDDREQIVLDRKPTPNTESGVTSSDKFSVDGKTLMNETISSMPDQQRCDDLQLAQADIQLRYDTQEQTAWLNAHAVPNTVLAGTDIVFATYSNYPVWIDHAEIRIFVEEDSPQATPLQVLPVILGQPFSWTVAEDEQALRYTLRVYDAEGRFDETRPKTLHITHNKNLADESDDLLAGYGEDSRAISNIPVNGGAVTVNGSGISTDASVSVMGQLVPIDKQGKFAVRQILPHGPHHIPVQIQTTDGQVSQFGRDINIATDDWFYVALADLTMGRNQTSGSAKLVTADETDRYDDKIFVDGRLAFYLKGKIKGEYLLTASADTREKSLDELFSNFSEKDPRSLLRRLDPDQYYPVYGDDSTTIEDAPTQGKFYVRLQRGDSHVLWGNFHTRIHDSELVRYNRGLYGAQLSFSSEQSTEFGERKGVVEAFAADPGSLAGRDEFRATGGSLYYLQRQDVTVGSERLWIEVRDKDTGLVLETNYLAPQQDYELNYLQGRVLLLEPLSSTASDNQLIKSDSLSGHAVYLVSTYEYTPGFTEADDLVRGGRGSYWFNDHLRVGMSGYKQNSPGMSQDLYGADVLLRWTSGTYLKLEGARSEGPGSGAQNSIDGGFNFNSQQSTGGGANAKHIEAAIDFADISAEQEGKANIYWQKNDSGFSGPGQIAATQQDASRKGLGIEWQTTETTGLSLKASEAEGLGQQFQAAELDVKKQLSEQWAIGVGLRADNREISTPTASQSINDKGFRSDLGVRIEHTPLASERFEWSSFAYVQTTVEHSGERQRNDRLGLGGRVRLTERFTMSSELSTGVGGLGALVGGEYQHDDRTSYYLNYELDPDRTDIGYRGRQGLLTSGSRKRFSEHGSVFAEQQLQHGDGPSGLTRAFGLDFAPDDRWTYGLRTEFGRITDPVSGDLRRKVFGGSLGYHLADVRYGGNLEFRKETGAVGERSSWLMRNNLGYQVNTDWRFLSSLDLSFSDAANSDFLDADFTEFVSGFAYRPVDNDKLNLLFKYSFLYDLASAGQLTDANSLPDFAQRSHVLSIDSVYDTKPWVSIGGKAAWRSSALRNSRVGGSWFDSQALLLIGRADLHIVHKWDAVVEARMLDISEADDRRVGMLLGVYRHVHENFKAGVGYNFTDFSDDITDLSYDSRGWFLNLTGKF